MNLWKASTIGLVLLFGLTIGGTAVTLADVEPQPHMNHALVRLKEAREALKAATHDHGGHRAKALEHTDKAIKEVEEAIAWANEHAKDVREKAKDDAKEAKDKTKEPPKPVPAPPK